jgi:N-acetylglucosamine-6-phosphate deacetylase
MNRRMAGTTGLSGRLGVAAAMVDGAIVRGDVEIRDGCIASVGVGVGGSGRGLAIPALVDLQVNGYAGVDFADASPDAYRHAERALLADGVAAYLPTIITAPEDDLLAALRRAATAIATWEPGGARPLGVHLEGPFISPVRRGVHPLEAIRTPDIALAERLLDAAPITLFTLAPERPGALQLIRWIRLRGVTVSLGHSDASYEEARAGFDAGARSVTHFFNGTRPMGHRDPGIVAAALLQPGVRLGMIPDGIHVAREVLELVRRVAGPRVYFVTDAVAAARAPDGAYRLGAVEVRREGGRVFGAEGQIGGGTIPLVESIRALVETGTPLAGAIRSATIVPSRVVRRRDVGALRIGSVADLLVLDDDLALRQVLSGGRVVRDA